jgi:hypothetical protein
MLDSPTSAKRGKLSFNATYRIPLAAETYQTWDWHALQASDICLSGHTMESQTTKFASTSIALHGSFIPDPKISFHRFSEQDHLRLPESCFHLLLYITCCLETGWQGRLFNAGSTIGWTTSTRFWKHLLAQYRWPV